jgi:hypothetical protein
MLTNSPGYIRGCEGGLYSILSFLSVPLSTFSVQATDGILIQLQIYTNLLRVYLLNTLTSLTRSWFRSSEGNPSCDT